MLFKVMADRKGRGTLSAQFLFSKDGGSGGPANRNREVRSVLIPDVEELLDQRKERSSKGFDSKEGNDMKGLKGEVRTGFGC